MEEVKMLLQLEKDEEVFEKAAKKEAELIMGKSSGMGLKEARQICAQAYCVFINTRNKLNKIQSSYYTTTSRR